MKSLEGRLQLGLVVTLVVLMGLIWLIGSQALRSMTEGFVASRLEHDAEGLLAAMMIDRGGMRLRWRRINQVYSQPLSGHYYVSLSNTPIGIFLTLTDSEDSRSLLGLSDSI